MGRRDSNREMPPPAESSMILGRKVPGVVVLLHFGSLVRPEGTSDICSSQTLGFSRCLDRRVLGSWRVGHQSGQAWGTTLPGGRAVCGWGWSLLLALQHSPSLPSPAPFLPGTSDPCLSVSGPKPQAWGGGPEGRVWASPLPPLSTSGWFVSGAYCLNKKLQDQYPYPQGEVCACGFPFFPSPPFLSCVS